MRKSVGPVSAFFITVSCIAPSIAVFIVGADVMRQVGTGVFLCFAAAAVLGLLMACVYGELGSAIPGAGGEYTIFDRVFGRLAGRSIIGLNLLGFSVSLALSGSGVATYLGALWPGVPAHVIAPAVVAAVTIVAVLRIEVGAVVTGAFLLTELTALAVVALLGFRHAARPVSALVHPVVATPGGLMTPSLTALCVATAAGVYAFNGYGAAIFFGEDMKDARRHTAPVVLGALLAGVLIVMPPIVAIILGAPNLRTVTDADTPIMATVAQLGGPRLARVMSLGVGLAILNTAIAIALMAGRQLYATAQDRLWPERVNRALAAIHPRWGSPWAATLIMGGCGIAGTLLNPHVLVLILGNSNVVTYSGLCVAALWGRRSGTTGSAPWRMPAYPLPPVLALAVFALVAGFTLLDPAGRFGLMISIVTIVTSAVLFSWLGRRRTAARDGR